MHTPTDDEIEAQVVDQWIAAAPALAAARRADVARLDDATALAATLDLLAMVDLHDLPPRTTSGLVEQQRIFRRALPA